MCVIEFCHIEKKSRLHLIGKAEKENQHVNHISFDKYIV
jgi:hypothetical protein